MIRLRIEGMRHPGNVAITAALRLVHLRPKAAKERELSVTRYGAG
jgi:hypothetical protein